MARSSRRPERNRGRAELCGGVPVGGSVSGVIDANGDVDYYTVNLVAGQTYLFSMRGTGGTPINDSLLLLINPAFTAYVDSDDDGGNDLYSLFTYTATETGTYAIQAQTFVNPTPDVGGYTIDVRQQGADAVGDTNATAVALELGTTFGFRETGSGGTPIDPLLAGDLDRYSVQLEAGQFYTFQLAGGADYATNPNAVPAGELDTFLILRNSAGNIVAANDDNSFPSDISSGIGFYAETGGTYYIDATAYAGNTGGYALTFNQVDISTLDPLDAIDWASANNVPFVNVGGVPTAYVYFALPGESFGELNDAGDGPRESFGWQQHEIDAVMLALEQYEHILGTNYVITTDVNQATFRLITTTSEDFGAYFYPQDPAFGDAAGHRRVQRRQRRLDGVPAEPGSGRLRLRRHPARIRPRPRPRPSARQWRRLRRDAGVTGPFSLGVYDLNQGVYTVMSYNDAWQTPSGRSVALYHCRHRQWLVGNAQRLRHRRASAALRRPRVRHRQQCLCADGCGRTTPSTRRSGTPAAPTRSLWWIARRADRSDRRDARLYRRPAAASYHSCSTIRRRRPHRPKSRAATRSPTAWSSRMRPAAAATTS